MFGIGAGRVGRLPKLPCARASCHTHTAPPQQDAGISSDLSDSDACTRVVIIPTSIQNYTQNKQYGAEAVDTGGKLRTTCWSRTSSPALGHKSCVVAALIARVKTCSDFRLPSHVSHSRTERALQLASQHVVAGTAVLVLPELSSSHE